MSNQTSNMLCTLRGKSHGAKKGNEGKAPDVPPTDPELWLTVIGYQTPAELTAELTEDTTYTPQDRIASAVAEAYAQGLTVPQGEATQRILRMMGLSL